MVKETEANPVTNTQNDVEKAKVQNKEKPVTLMENAEEKNNSLPQIKHLQSEDAAAARNIIRLEKQQEAGLPLSPVSDKAIVMPDVKNVEDEMEDVLQEEHPKVVSSIGENDQASLNMMGSREKPNSIDGISKIEAHN